MATISLKKKYRTGKSYKSQSSSKSISGSSNKKGRGTGGKRHPNQKDMILVVRPGFRKMMTMEEFKEFENK